jgi:hypothetical protein
VTPGLARAEENGIRRWLFVAEDLTARMYLMTTIKRVECQTTNSHLIVKIDYFLLKFTGHLFENGGSNPVTKNICRVCTKINSSFCSLLLVDDSLFT